MVSVYQNSRLRATHLEWNPRNRELHSVQQELLRLKVEGEDLLAAV